MESNLPPFYVGQKVVYVGWDPSLKNTIHTVNALYKLTCGCWIVYSDTLPLGEYDMCSNCNKKTTRVYARIAMAKSLSPIQEQNFPLITLEKIQEKEREKEQVKEYDNQLIGGN